MNLKKTFLHLSLLLSALAVQAQELIHSFTVDENEVKSSYLNIWVENGQADLILRNAKTNKITIHRSGLTESIIKPESRFANTKYPYLGQRFQNNNSTVYYFGDGLLRDFAFAGIGHSSNAIKTGFVDFDFKSLKVITSTIIRFDNGIYQMGLSLKNKSIYFNDITNPTKVKSHRIELDKEMQSIFSKYLYKNKPVPVYFGQLIEDKPQFLKTTAQNLKLYVGSNNLFLLLDDANSTHLFSLSIKNKTIKHIELPYFKTKKSFSPNGASTLLDNKVYQLSLNDGEYPNLRLFSIDGELLSDLTLDDFTPWKTQPSKDKMDVGSGVDKRIDYKKFYKKIGRDGMKLAITANRIGDDVEIGIGTYDEKIKDSFPDALYFLSGSVVGSLLHALGEGISKDELYTKSFFATVNLTTDNTFSRLNEKTVSLEHLKAYYNNRKIKATYFYGGENWYVGYYENGQFHIYKYPIYTQ